LEAIVAAIVDMAGAAAVPIAIAFAVNGDGTKV